MTEFDFGEIFYKKDLCYSIDNIQDYFFISSDYNPTTSVKKFFRIPKNKLKKFCKFITNNNLHLYENFNNNLPVKPYFDLEIDKIDITNAECVELLNEFIDILIKYMDLIFKINVKKNDFIILDSCREHKLSYHLILYKKYYFKNNFEQKKFIGLLKYIFKYSIDENNNKIYQKFMWFHIDKQNNSKTKLIFDPIPYSSNQNIRLIYQSKLKYGNNYTLQPNKNINVYDTLIVEYHPEDKIEIDTSLIYDYSNTIINNVDEEIINDDVNDNEEKPKKKIGKKNINKKIIYDDDDFNKIGKRLKDTITNDEYFKLSKILQYLYLIPYQEDYEYWYIIGCCIKSANLDKKYFIEFSKLNSDYTNETECDNFKYFKNKSYAYSMFILKKYATLSNPDFLLSKECSFYKYNNINIAESEFFHVYNENTQYICQDDPEYLFSNDKFTILSTYMGKGKTMCIGKIINKFKNIYKRVIVITSRMSFSYFIHKEISDKIVIHHYKDLQKPDKIKELIDNDKEFNDLNIHDNIVIQIESLTKINHNYDLIILDESESVFKQFSSSTMIEKYGLTFNIFHKLIINSKKVILADAFIKSRTIDYIRAFEKSSSTMIINKSPPVIRKAFQISPDKIIDNLTLDLKNGKKIYCFFGSQALLEKFEFHIKHYKDLNIKYEFYHKNTNNNDTLKDVNTYWKNMDLIATTSKLTVGVSYTNENHFDKIYCIFSNHSCCVRDVMQSLMRVRHIKDNELYFSIPNEKQLKMEASKQYINYQIIEDYNNFKLFNNNKKKLFIDKIKNIIQTNKNINKDNKDKFDTILQDLQQNSYDTPEPLQKILYFNLFEDIVSTVYFKEMVYFYLNECGYEISFSLFDIEKKIIPEKNIVNINELDFYNNILSIEAPQHKEILNTIRSNNADEKTKLISKKFIFQHFISNDTSDDIKSKIFYHFFHNEFQKHILLNLFIEKNNNDAHKFIIDDFFKSNFLIEQNKMRGLKFDYILQINKLLGLKHSHDTDTIIDISLINNNIQWFTDNLHNINNIFSLFNTVNNKGPISKLIIVKLIKKIYSSWSNSNFIPNTVDRKKIATSYKLTIDTTLWPHIKQNI